MIINVQIIIQVLFMTNALVSVIITSYKGSLMIKEAIDSILHQTYKNIEIIVVDDNGKGTEEQNRTEHVVNGYAQNTIKYIVHDINLNGAAARNTGINNCKGKYIAFLDNDDLFLSNHIEMCVNKSEETGKDAILSNVLYMNNNQIYDYEVANTSDLQKKLLIKRSGLFTGSNLFLKSNCVKEIGGFDEKFTRLQDVEFMIRFLDKYSIASINEFNVVKRFNGNVNVPNYKKHLLINESFIKKFSRQINELSEEEKKLFYNQLDIEMFNNAVFEGNKSDIKSAYKILCSNVGTSIINRIKYVIGMGGKGRLLSVFSFKIKKIKRKRKIREIILNFEKEPILKNIVGRKYCGIIKK